MPRKFLRRFIPDASFFHKHAVLKPIAHWLHEPAIWHLNRHAVMKAFFIGILVAMLPLPAHMLIAGYLAVRLNANLPISVGLVWVSNPLTMPFIYVFSYKLGSKLLFASHYPSNFNGFSLNVGENLHEIQNILLPLFVGGIFTGIVLGFISSLLVSFFWHQSVRYRWRQRQNRSKH